MSMPAHASASSASESVSSSAAPAADLAAASQLQQAPASSSGDARPGKEGLADVSSEVTREVTDDGMRIESNWCVHMHSEGEARRGGRSRATEPHEDDQRPMTPARRAIHHPSGLHAQPGRSLPIVYVCVCVCVCVRVRLRVLCYPALRVSCDCAAAGRAGLRRRCRRSGT